MNIRELVDKVNIADKLDEEDLKKIGDSVWTGFHNDKRSRKDWERDYDDWQKIALQIVEEKTYPWPNASNVTYPLLSTAAMQFSARAYPALVPSDGKVVKVQTFGADPTGEKQKKAERLSKFMSYQVLEEVPEWEDDMDKLLLILPIIGTAYKKTYWDTSKQAICSRLVLPKDLVVNYWAKSLEDCERKTHVLLLTKRQYKERVLGGLFLDVDLPEPGLVATEYTKNERTGTEAGQDDETTPYMFLEQHTFVDLDKDGYPEPYVVTIEESTKSVVRITPRFYPENIETNEKNEIIKITPIEYFTQYIFLPSPDGSILGVGFGRLLGPLNEAANTGINQLLDAGHIHNLQAGFISKGLRMKSGDTTFKPGEWKPVQATTDDLRKGIVPLPSKEPSAVLFSLLQFLLQSAKELASIAEIMVGKMPGQNTPATTTQIAQAEGMRVFTAIFKRVFRSLKSEFQKIFTLDFYYLDEKHYSKVMDEPVSREDFDDALCDVKPAADPQATSFQEKQAKAQALMQLIPSGKINVDEAIARLLEAQEQPNIDRLINKQPPPPPPEVQKAQMEMKMKQEEHQMKMQFEKLKFELEKAKAQMQMQIEQLKMEMEKQKLGIKAQEIQLQAQADQQNLMFEQQMNHETQEHEMEMNQVKQEQANMQMENKREQIKMQGEQQKAQAKMKQQKAKAKTAGGT